MAEAFGVAASALAVVELSVKVVKICTQYTKDVTNARQDIRRLHKEVESLGAVAKSVRELFENTPQHKVATIEKVHPALDEGRMLLTGLQTKLAPSQRGKYMSRIGLRAMKWPFSSKDLEKALADLARLTQVVSLAMSVDQTTLLLSLEQKAALAKLPVAEGAAYDSHADEHNPQCLEHTRTEVLKEIVEWARDSSLKAVYWLNGMAGTGKSTISRTIANKFSKNDNLGARLGATFFFKRGEGDRGKMSKLFTTIASQLVQQLPEIAGHVQAAIEANPDLISKAMSVQFKTLIVDPVTKISSIDPTRRILIFVIDALDECDQERDVQLLIELLSGIPRDMDVQLRFFLTSRPDLPIRLGFHAIDGKYRDFILHEVAGSIIEHDLQVYLQHELERTRLAFNQGLPEERKLPADWPNPKDLGSLVQMAIPLFIFAATICRFVADRRGGNPEAKLRRVLEHRATQGSKLMATYMPVLEQLTMDLTPGEQWEILSQFQQIVGSIVVLADPLGSNPLSRLLDIKPNEILELLDFLHSVLQIPSLPEQPIRLLHLSFRDFLIDPAREGNPFWINERKVHQQLAGKCLRVLNSSLKNDICGVKAPGTLASSISASSIMASIPPELQYACRFWAYHLCEASSPGLHKADMRKFLGSHFLHWLEALSWIGRLPESFGIVTTLQFTSLVEGDHEMTQLLKDSIRFIQAAKSSIHIAPLQAYSSSLAFAPTQSIVRRMYERDMSDCIVIGPQMPSSWDGRLQTFEVDSGAIVQIAFLSDGKLLGVATWGGIVVLLAADTGELRLRLEGRGVSKFLSAFSPDGKLLALVMDFSKVTLRYIETGETLHTFIGHEEAVKRIVFSPDSRLLASVSRDGVVILWSVATGKRQQTLEISSEPFHSDSLWELAISPDNELLALTSLDHTIILWDIETGNRRQILRGHSAWIHSIAFSPDSNLLASASKDQTIVLWDTKTAEQQRTLRAHTDTVTMLAFSLNNKLLASASDDRSVILWQPETGQKLRSLQGHDSRVIFIEFSPNGRLLASTDPGGTVLLWGAETGELLRKFESSSHLDNCISFSPDSKRLIATSGFKSISVWAIDTKECGQMPEKHSESVNTMRFSPDKKLLATASCGGGVILWRVDTGEHRQTLEGHSLWINRIAFSPDSKLLATVSIDLTVVLWTVDTGERWQTLRGHTDHGTDAVFSPDGKMVATASYDQTVALWTTNTGVRRHILRGHTNSVRTVAFSPDGKILASASDDQTIALWATDTGARCQTLEGHSAKINSIAFSPNSKTLALALENTTVALWATESGECRQILGGYSADVKCLLFSCDSKLCLMYRDTAVIEWAAETDEPQQSPLEIDYNDSSLGLDRNAPRIVVVRGPALPSGSNGTDDVGPSISQDHCWICLKGEPVLWLPLEYRPYRTLVSGNVLAIGCETGRVLLVRPGPGAEA